MVVKNPNSPGPLTHEEGEKWWQAFLAAEVKVLNPDKPLTVEGAVHLCFDFAWSSLEAYRRAVKGERS